MVERMGVNFLENPDAMFQLAYRRALELADFKGGFLARTAHELRSPLNKIISLQQMILEGLCDDIEEEREFVAEAYAAAMKLLEYLDFLIRVSKVEMGRVQPTLKAVSLAPILDDVKTLNHLQVTDRNLHLIVTPPDEALQVWTDSSWLQNILTTLIDIALENRDRGTLHLGLAPDSPLGTCYLWFADDRSSTHWQEPITLPAVADFDLEASLSASLRMAMVEAMLRAMGGKLSLLSVTDDTSPRWQLELPMKPANDPDVSFEKEATPQED